MTVIAMTREMGSLGKDVALGLSVQMGLTVVHHELVERDLADRMDMRESEVHRFLEGQASLLERWKIDQTRLSRYTADEILQLAQRDNVLIRGWGATHLLSGVHHVIRVRVCAPMSSRIERLMERLGIEDRAVARREIQRSDAAHTRVMHSFFDADWENPINYDIVLNTAHVPVEACIDQVRLLTESPAFKVTEDSRGALNDKLIETRVRAALVDSAEPTFEGRSFDIEVADGKVVLSGATSNQRIIENMVQLVGAVDGVKEIENKISYVAPVPMI